MATAEIIVRMHRGVRSDQTTGNVSRKDHESPLPFDPALLSPVGGEAVLGPSL